MIDPNNWEQTYYGSCRLVSVYNRTGAATTSNSSVPREFAKKVLIGSSTPNWKEVRKQIVLPNNNFYTSKSNLYYSVGAGSSVSSDMRRGTSNYFTGCMRGRIFESSPNKSPCISDAELQSAHNDAIISLRNRLKDTRFNLGVFVAERASTLEMITANARIMANALIALKQGNITKAAKFLGIARVSPKSRVAKRFKQSFAKHKVTSVSSAWLQLQYGWLPLMSDAQGAAESLSRLLNDFVMEKVTSKKVIVSEKVTPIISDGFHEVKHDSTETTIRYVLFYKSTLDGGAGQIRSLGITNPAELLWEMTPFSMVVDYFIPIGNYVASLDAHIGVEFQSGTYTVKHDTVNVSNLAVKYKTGTNTVEGFSTATYKEISKNRKVLKTIPFPEIPGIKSDAVKTNQWFNMAALLTQAMSK